MDIFWDVGYLEVNVTMVMEKLKKARTPIRGLITKTINEVTVELAKEEKDVIMLKAKFERLNDLQQRIQEVDASIFNEMLSDPKMSDEDQLNEAISCEDIVTSMVTTKLKIDCEITKMECVLKDHKDDGLSSVTSASNRKRQFKLPKIELKKFSGKILDWLSWWAQFSKIDEDEELHLTDKFQYLIQSMEPNSKGADIVNGFPATEDNYPKVIQVLKDRFGRKKLLIQVYIRELFKMSLDNMNRKASLASIYDKLVCHIRALDSLNVTVEQASLFLFPMVEASLPEDTLVAWQRSTKYEMDGSIENPRKSELDYLLEFLQQEVEREEQRAISSCYVRKDNEKQRLKEYELPMSTAAALHVGEMESDCIFCGKQHESQDCESARGWSKERKWKAVNDEKACCKCLRRGHYGKNCKEEVKCTKCSRWHYQIMCTNQ